MTKTVERAGADGEAAPGAATDLLLRWGVDEEAPAALITLVYDELRRMARTYLRRERPDHTLQPTALVHEAYLRMIDQRRVDWRNRAQFVGLAATMMRRILVNHARDRAAAKRGGDAEHVPLTISTDQIASDEPPLDLMELHDALDRLHALDTRKSRIVELKFFGGLTTDEISEVIAVSPATVERDWMFARAWLRDALGSPEGLSR
ncbi:MAG TPA: sigma-70 family RNA polymerase sigma factor [Vicinamibacterales bacterium]